MTTIILGQPGRLNVTVLRDGVPVPVDSDASLSAYLYSADGRDLVATLDPPTADAGWAQGNVTIDVPAGAVSEAGELMLALAGPFGVIRYRVRVEDMAAPERSTLFIRDLVVAEVRADRVSAAAMVLDPTITVSDDYIWQKVLAAEADIGRELRVPLVPTQFFPEKPTDQQLAALPPGMPWAIDPAYDYNPDFFRGERWGFILTRQKPIVEVQEVRFVYPDPSQGLFTLPLNWVRMDAKYGHIRFVPASQTFAAPLSAFLMQALGGGRTIPFMIQLTYRAGLENVARDFPDLLDAIKKKAVLKLVEDRFLPQSGSISSDGLSQSISVQMDQYRDAVSNILYGAPGTNGGIMTAIHGIRVGVAG